VAVTTDILYLSFNRLAFTRFSFAMLLANTDWTLVDRLVIYDDGSHDGTREFFDDAIRAVPADTTLRSELLRSPPATMNRYIRQTTARYFVKIDSDIAVPPGWLTNLSTVMWDNPALDLLGMEGGRTGIPRKEPAGYGYQLCTHIGGVGMMKTRPFRECGPIPEQGRYGFTQWQQDHGLVRAWITPDLLVCELDKVPEQPWISLTERYIREGWARQWGTYESRYPYWYEWFDPALVTACTADTDEADA
jgi:glycosyltransferase involved in cell wall biosynthesis